MIYIQRQTTNEFALELSNIIPSNEVYFLFEFLWLEDLESPKRFFTSPNLSNNVCRYDLFNLTEGATGSTGNATNSPIRLENGQWNYSVWSSDTEFYPNDLGFTPPTTSPLSSGRMVVWSPSLDTFDGALPSSTGTGVYE